MAAAATSPSGRSLASAGGLLLGTTVLAIALGAGIGAAFGAAGVGFLVGALVGIPLAVAVVYRVYSGSAS
ncbi:MAG: hypothetical protein U0R50_12365 [Gaiellales bacterium]